MTENQDKKAAAPKKATPKPAPKPAPKEDPKPVERPAVAEPPDSF